MILFAILCIILLRNANSTDLCTSKYCPPYLQKTKSTLEENLPKNYLGIQDGCLCRESPDEYTICYSEHKCNKFPTWLKLKTPALVLKSTEIESIQNEDFSEYTDLKNLILEENNYFSNIEPSTFQNLSKLTELSIIHNPRLQTLHPGAFFGLVNLRRLFLVKNGFNDILHLTLALSPSILPSLQYLNVNKNIFRNIYVDDFFPMENSTVEELSMSLCSIENIHEKSFLPLKNLQTLYLGDNRLDAFTITKLMNETLRNDIPLKNLALNSLGFRKEAPKDLMKIISKSNVTSLNLKENYFDIIDFRTFPEMINLELLDLTDNSVQTVEINAFDRMPNLRTLILNKNKLSMFPKELRLYNLTRLEIEENVDFYYGVQFSLEENQFKNFKNLEHLSFQYTRLLAIYNMTFYGSNNLKYLNLKNCSLIFIANNTFLPLKNLKYLNLESNGLHAMWTLTSKYNLNALFKGLENLETLLLGKNNIQQISMEGVNPFFYLKSLQHLSLHKNQIQYLSPNDFKHLKSLRSLDISKNSITSWNDQIFLFKSLKIVLAQSNKISFINRNMLYDFSNLTYLSLYSNRFTCNCWTLKDFSKYPKSKVDHFFKIMKDPVQCVHFTNISFEDFIRNPSNYTYSCTLVKYPMIYVLPLVIVIVIFLVLGILAYIYRWHIRYWIFLTRLYLTRIGKSSPKSSSGCSNHTYDAFISYCNEDQNFVMRLVTMLENYEPFLRLCVYEREFKIGSVISESILEHIAKSRKTVLIVSDSYAKSYWCTWETQIAEHHRLFFKNSADDGLSDSLVLIKLGAVNESHLTPTLKYLLKTRIYLQWNPDEEKQKVFWDKLRQCLSPPKNLHCKRDVVYCSRL